MTRFSTPCYWTCGHWKLKEMLPYWLTIVNRRVIPISSSNSKITFLLLSSTLIAPQACWSLHFAFMLQVQLSLYRRWFYLFTDPQCSGSTFPEHQSRLCIWCSRNLERGADRAFQRTILQTYIIIEQDVDKGHFDYSDGEKPSRTRVTGWVDWNLIDIDRSHQACRPRPNVTVSLLNPTIWCFVESKYSLPSRISANLNPLNVFASLKTSCKFDMDISVGTRKDRKTYFWFVHCPWCDSNMDTGRDDSPIGKSITLKWLTDHEDCRRVRKSSQLIPTHLHSETVFSRWDSFKKLSSLRIFCKAVLVQPSSPTTDAISSRSSSVYSGWMTRSYKAWVRT